MQQAIKPVAAVLNENYKKQLATNEYMLILNPHEELRGRIQQVKKEFHEKYQVPSSLGGQPQITIVRFTQLALMEERIVQRLRTIAMGYCPFKVELKDFGSFPTHTIFIQVTSKLPIRGLVTEIKDAQRLMKLDKENKPHFIDEPYLTVARKLLPWQYEKAWLEYSNKSFTGRFIADGMLLLRRPKPEQAAKPEPTAKLTAKPSDENVTDPRNSYFEGAYSGTSSGTRSRVMADAPYQAGTRTSSVGSSAGQTPRLSRAWQIAERFAFQNLPVATRQGELFALPRI